ncbi:reverse transcriptase domain-containing protein [Streptomyces turgidiscabies]|uniref:reverse transcriptase domain-containing protein n=1 Tax=Streptomyces TaxID=1883 RepID=UPI00131A26F4|nr:MULTISPECIES: reverse transcriptase domain-containing protein [Streptomyces]MDX3492439.1 reverse transcriptase domain-containing protein [Streptomyces turgidiscabies]
MLVSPKIMQSLDLSSATEFCLSTPLDRLPILISDRCLMDSKRSAIKWVEANFCGGTRIPKEIMTMPKNKFGQRPIILTSLTSRIIYQALVSSVADAMEPNSRGGEGWVQHETFAEESPSEFIVEVDIAACYEFIDHERLRQELVARTLNVEVAKNITEFLGECSPNKRGLPQLTSASDTLGDLYLSIIQRQLMRQGLDVSRYADDFLIRAKNWEQANETIEYAAEFARDLGLILSYRHGNHFIQSSQNSMAIHANPAGLDRSVRAPTMQKILEFQAGRVTRELPYGSACHYKRINLASHDIEKIVSALSC